MRYLTYATVCSGIECMSAACADLPMKPVFFSEIEPFPCAVLKSHFPNVPNLGDMSKIEIKNDGKEITNGTTRIILDRRLDIFAGGTPCQDVSVAGKRSGMQEGSGTRSSLAFEFVRLVRELKPRYVLWENVAGVLSDKSFPEFLTALANCGYGVAYRTLDAQYIRVADCYHEDGGVVRMERAIPQRRRRVWVIGCLGGDVAKASQILFEPKGFAGDNPPRRRTWQEIAAASRGRNRIHGGMVGDASGDRECLNPTRAQDSHVKSIEGDIHDPKYAQQHKTQSFNFELYNIADQACVSLGSERAADTMAINEICTLMMRAGKPGGGKGPLVADNRSQCLSAANMQVLFQNQPAVVCGFKYLAGAKSRQPIGGEMAYGIDQQGGKGHSAVAEGVAPTMCSDSHGTPHGVAYKSECYENHAQDSRVKPIEVANTLGANNGDCLTGMSTLFVGFNKVSHARGKDGEGERERWDVGEVASTRNVFDISETRTQEVVVGMAQNTRDEVRIVGDGNVAGALAAEPGMKQQTYVVSADIIAKMKYIVRRLTPTECERLMGLPDGWTIPSNLVIMDELVEEFRRIHDTFKRIMWEYSSKEDIEGDEDENGELPKATPPKPTTSKQVRKWLEKIINPDTCPDTPRYKGCGNGWAANQPRWILTRLLVADGINPFEHEGERKCISARV